MCLDKGKGGRLGWEWGRAGGNGVGMRWEWVGMGWECIVSNLYALGSNGRQLPSILLTSEHDSGDGVHRTSSQCCSAHSSSCRRRHLYTHCWAPLRPTAAHRHTRHWCSRPRTWTTWGVGVLVVRGEAKSQQPYLVVYTWRDDIVWPCTWTCILSRDVRKIDHHTNWHDGFSGLTACAGAEAHA